MNRRDAIKNISLGLGYAISSTTILQVFNSCSGSKKNDIYFFNRKELYVINNLVEIIIPNSEKNTVMDLFLSKFTDKMLINTNSPEEQQIFRLGAEAFINKFELLYNKDAKKGFPK
ncbi:MAG: gluconate 2-dehydrogenase subunit 3 family protein, partial [Bacteroidota bacterium]